MIVMNVQDDHTVNLFTAEKLAFRLEIFFIAIAAEEHAVSGKIQFIFQTG